MVIKENKTKLFVAIVFLLVGILFLSLDMTLVVPYLSFEKLHRNDIKTTIKTSLYEENNQVYMEIAYEVNGQLYEKVYNDAETINALNQQISSDHVIYVDPSDPEKFASYESPLPFEGAVIIGLLGLAFTLTGGFMLCEEIVAHGKKKLMRTGICKRLPIVEIQYGQGSKTIKGPGYYHTERTQYVVLEDRHVEEDIAYRYKSRDVFADFKSEYRVGGRLSVYIDPKNPNNYYIDLTSYSYSPDDNVERADVQI